ncbi:DUF1643 domain-containing protein [Fundicoccus culcitae]|uniref:DUF1643 domain-containing protein n=1 Tax=Fundicoccus culcitae TaxID=2969821 RepID=A0ABY5P3Z7_9LACT|nr:DUF1643 domain-containing protein [Fundicoccus culcitae]UUX33269.1 DUF1643 domain-containing protein [Fundicoccus culcitae]
MKELTTLITVKTIEEDDGSHRYVLERIWDPKQPKVTIITLYPSISELVITDLTTMHMTNSIHKLGFGGFFSVNLFSKPRFPEFPKNGKHTYNFKTATNKSNDEQILACCKDSNLIILAYGSLPEKNKQVKQRLKQLLALLKKEDLSEKVKVLTDSNKLKCYHPLSPKVQKNWVLVDSQL